MGLYWGCMGIMEEKTDSTIMLGYNRVIMMLYWGVYSFLVMIVIIAMF